MLNYVVTGNKGYISRGGSRNFNLGGLGHMPSVCAGWRALPLLHCTLVH